MTSSITHILNGSADALTVAFACTFSVVFLSFLSRRHSFMFWSFVGLLPVMYLPDYTVPLPECCGFLRDIDPPYVVPVGFFVGSMLLFHLLCSYPRRSESHYIIDESVFDDMTLVSEENRGREYSLEEMEQVVEEMRSSYNSGITRPIAKRIEQLKCLLRFFKDHADDIHKAVAEDLSRPNVEIGIYEVKIPIADIKTMIKQLSEWTQPEEVGSHILSFPSKQFIQPEPLGLSLVIGTWNYPVQLTLVPVAAAIAAGNTVILKPSNISKATARLIADELPKYMDPRVMQVVGANYPVNDDTDGDYLVGNELLKHRYDMIFFTGSPAVGKIVMKAASKYLTPVVLELGGKNPVYIDSNADIELAAKRTVWARMFNAGQQCIAPDYVLCHRDVVDEFAARCKFYCETMYENHPECKQIGRIVNQRRMNVLKKVMADTLADENTKLIHGGEIHEEAMYISPTVVQVPFDSPLMQDETFGPMLAITTVDNVNEAIAFINSREKPLALYAFTNDSNIEKLIVNNTSSGGVTVNSCLYHAGHPGLPFGGVGNSGMGAYHGKAGFDAFSHMKPVMLKSVWTDFGLLSDPFFLYPPYTNFKEMLVNALLNSL
eukprot:m.39258 g.39258  ORF g.39258 m.39258 type:complete len:604 (+) comp10281_c0_seq2:50-1861(+)